MTPQVVSTLDACKVSYRNAVEIIAAVAHTLGRNLNDLVLNTSSYHAARQKIREEQVINMNKMFGEIDIKWMIIHFNGKLISDDTFHKKFDRVPIIVRYKEGRKLLNVPCLPDSKGETQAYAIYETLNDYHLTERIIALCCDTTNSNLG